jgi:hypothetical protein
MTTKRVNVKWIDAKFCQGIHRIEDALEHRMDTYNNLVGTVCRQNSRE